MSVINAFSTDELQASWATSVRFWLQTADRYCFAVGSHTGSYEGCDQTYPGSSWGTWNRRASNKEGRVMQCTFSAVKDNLHGLGSDQLRRPLCIATDRSRPSESPRKMIAKPAGTLLFSMCRKAIPNSIVNTSTISMIIGHNLPMIGCAQRVGLQIGHWPNI